MTKPVCTIVAGPNGAGKTTFALKWLPAVVGIRNFINADLIATGLSPLDIDAGQMRASRIFLTEVEKAIVAREDFAFETTLAGKAHIKRVQRMRREGWHVELIYLYLSSVEQSERRVAQRVAAGGHNIELAAIRRRYGRSLKNLVEVFQPMCDSTICFDSSEELPKSIFLDVGGRISVLDLNQYDTIKEVVANA